jgi:transcriptional regulator with XRE-family HTH domain
LYYRIFYSNVLRLLDQRGMTKHDLAAASGVSISFISEITTGKGNPSLETMAAIAAGLDVPLPYLLEHTDLDEATRSELAGAKATSTFPPGYEQVCVVLPTVRAHQVKKWGEEALLSLKNS